jgi:hypothetical protein
MSFQNNSFTLQQFHFHLPSEHLDAGKSMAMEMHMVWESADAKIAVVGVFIDVEDGAGGSPAANATAPAPPAATPAARKRDGFTKVVRKSETEGKDKRQLPGVGGSFFHVNAVGEISEPGTLTKTKGLSMAELVSTLAAGSFQT